MEVSNKIPKVEKKGSLISVIVPAYNIEEYLPTCLESIISQSYENIEIVLVDDGSTDGTGKIADDFQLKYPTKIHCLHLKNGGAMKARLAGIKAATGDWIGFVDGDDVIESDMYKKLLNNALTYCADISHCGYQTIVNGGERIHYFYNTGRILEQDRIEGLKDLLSGEFVEPGLWNKLFHKALFEQVISGELLDGSIRINEDLLMNYLLFKQAQKSIYEDFCPYHYLTRSTSATRSEFREYKVLDPMKVRKFILDDAEPEFKNLAWHKYLVCCLNACVALHGKKEWKKKYLEVRMELNTHRDKWNLLRRNELLKLKFFMLSAPLFKSVLRIYENYFQKKVYE